MGNLTLYEIKNKALEIAMNDELTEEERSELQEAIRNELLEKSEGVIAFTKKVEGLIEAIKNEESRLHENRKNYERKLESFKEYVKNCMMEMQVSKIETPLGEMKIAKNPISVEITDATKIPMEYWKEKVDVSLDKKGMIEHFKTTGEIINGVKFCDNNFSLRIK